MKIKKYASGGVYTGFTPSIPKTTGTTTTKNSGSSGSSKSSELPFTKELIEMIAAKGLPSDNTVFSNELAQILYRAQVSGADMPAHMVVAFSNKANTMAEMKADFDKAYDKVIELGTGSDIAIHNQFMYAEDLSKAEEEREMVLITPAQYLESPEQWKILTNQDILHARKYDANFAFNSSTIVSDAAGSTNLKLIREYWKEETKALATKATSGTLKQDVMTQDLVTGAVLLQSAKGDVDSSTTLQNEHVQSFLSSLYSSMQENEKGYVNAYLATRGIEPTSANILTFMFESIVDYVATSTKYSPEGKGSGKGSGSGSGDAEITGVTEDNQAIRIQQFLGPQEPIILKCKPGSPSDNTAAFVTLGIKQGRFIKQNGDFIKPCNLSELMGEAIAFAATDTRSVYMGPKKLEEGARTTIYWGGSEMEEVMLPPLQMEDGTIRPWFELMDYLGTVNSGNYAPMEAQNYLLKNGIKEDTIKYNKNTQTWELVIDTIPFLVFKAYLGEEYISLSDNDKRYFESVSEENGEYIANIMNSWKEWGTFESDNEYDNIYAGNVYIPIGTYWSTFNATENQYVLKSEYSNVYPTQAARELINAMQKDPKRKTINSNFTK